MPLHQWSLANILQLITTRNKFLTHLDISWSQMSSKLLHEFAKSLVTDGKLIGTYVSRNYNALRSLNLSYNTLC